MTTVRDSNAAWFDVLAPLPVLGIGYEVRCYNRNDPATLLALIDRWEQMSFEQIMNDTGSGTLQLLLDDRVLHDPLPGGLPGTILDAEHIFEVWWDGVLRGWFTGEELAEALVEGAEKPTVTITGRGRAGMLEYGTVLPPGYPTQPQIDSFNSISGWTCTGGTVALDTTDKVEGTGSMKIDWAGSGIALPKKSFGSPQDFSGLGYFALYVWADHNVPANGSFIRFYTDDTNYFSASLGALGTSARVRRMVALGGFSATGSPDWTNINKYGFAFANAGETSTEWHVDDLRTVPYLHQFSGTPALAIWLALLQEAQARGDCTLVTPSFTASVDSVGVPWTDSQTVSLPPGDNLLNLLLQYTALAGVDWYIHADGTLDVRQDFGHHYENSVRFFVASDQVDHGRQRNRRGLYTIIYAENSSKQLAEAIDSAAVTRWGRKELYVPAGAAIDLATLNTYAAATLRSSKQEALQITFTPTIQPGAIPFADYDVGDWVHVEYMVAVLDAAGMVAGYAVDANRSGDYQVVAIAMTHDAAGNAVPSLTLNSRLQVALVRQQRLLEQLLKVSTHSLLPTQSPLGTGASGGVGGTTQSTQPGPENLVDLGDVAVASPADADVLTWVATDGKWENQPSGGAASVFGDGKPGLWTPPTSPGTYDDEFADWAAGQSGPSAGLAAKWAKHNLGTSAWLVLSDSQAPGCLLFSLPSGQATDQQIYQSFAPVGDFSILCRFGITNLGDRQMWYLSCLDASGNGVGLGLDTGDTGYLRNINSWQQTGTTVATNQDLRSSANGALPVTVLLKRASGTYYGGLTWSDRLKAIPVQAMSRSFTLAYLAFGRVYGTGVSTCVLDFIRVS